MSFESHIKTCHEATFSTEAHLPEDYLQEWVELKYVDEYKLDKQRVREAIEEKIEENPYRPIPADMYPPCEVLQELLEELDL